MRSIAVRQGSMRRHEVGCAVRRDPAPPATREWRCRSRSSASGRWFCCRCRDSGEARGFSGRCWSPRQASPCSGGSPTSKDARTGSPHTRDGKPGSGSWPARRCSAAAISLALFQAGVAGALDDALGAIALAIAGVALVIGPWLLRLTRELRRERSERVRSQERADVAAHLHDSVLQTLALIQRQAGDSADRQPAGPDPGTRAAELVVRA